jgi:ribonuclease HI
MKYIFTDGSTFNNGKYGAHGGIGIYFDKMKIPDISMPFLIEHPTNNKTELYAINKALESVIDAYITKNISVKDKDYTIVSDSQYAIKSLTIWLPAWKAKDWKTSENKEVKNLCLIRQNDNLLFTAKKLGLNVQFLHTRSHKIEPKDKRSLEYFLWNGNNIADKLAKNGALKIGRFIGLLKRR